MPIFSGHQAKRRYEALVVVLLILGAVLGAIVGQPSKGQEIALSDHSLDDLDGSRRRPTLRAARAADALPAYRRQGDADPDSEVYYDPEWFRGDGENAEWRSFRGRHPELALGVAVTVTWALRAVAQRCVFEEADQPDVSISAIVTIQERDVLLEDIRCAPEAGLSDLTASRYCDCLLGGRPRELHAELPVDISDDGLRYYKGTMLLEHWTWQ